MTHSDLRSELLEVVRNYWRTRNAVAVFLGLDSFPADQLVEYTGVGIIDGGSPFPRNESLGASLKAIHAHAQGRMCNDAFLLLIAHYERFLSSKLKSSGASGKGTLGILQDAAKSRFGVSGPCVDLSLEIRERRNCLIHCDGQADAKYVAAASAAAAIGRGYIQIVAAGALILPTPEYLSYAADVLLQYAHQIP